MAVPDSASPLAAGQIEIWKKIVDVQQHFNDLELRIRNFALGVTGAFLGLGGYAIKDGGVLSAMGMQFPVSALVVFSAVLPLFAFYLMDRLWYHRLLDGAVEAGIEAENALKALGYSVDLGSKISARSPFTLWLLNWKIHSKRKMDFFYLMLVLGVLAVAFILVIGVRPQPPVSKERSTDRLSTDVSRLGSSSGTPASASANGAGPAASDAKVSPTGNSAPR
jgi:hypothetical protein